MAELYSVNYTKINVTLPSEKVNSGDANGKMKCLFDEFNLSGALGLNDEILIQGLPKGCRVHEVVLESEALGGSCQLSMGFKGNGVDAEDDDAFIPATSAASAVIAKMSDAAGNAGMLKILGGETIPFIKAVAASGATSGKIKVGIYFTND